MVMVDAQIPSGWSLPTDSTDARLIRHPSRILFRSYMVLVENEVLANAVGTVLDEMLARFAVSLNTRSTVLMSIELG